MNIEYIVTKYGNLIYSTCKGYFYQKCDVDDAYQESLIRIHKSLDKIDPDKSLINWIITVTKSCCCNLLRSKKSKKNSIITNAVPLNEDLVLDSIQMRTQKCKELVDSLSEITKVIITLYYIQRLTQEEIAEELGISLYHVRKHINDGLYKLREIL